METISFKSRRAQAKNKAAHDSQHQSLEADVRSAEIVSSLAEIWKAVLRVESVDMDDNFFAVGGTSLHAMLMASRVEKAMSIQIPLVTFFDNPTFSGLVGCAMTQ